MSARCASFSVVRPARGAGVLRTSRPRILQAAAAARPQLQLRRRLRVAAAADSPPVDVSHLDEDISECPFGTGKRGRPGRWPALPERRRRCAVLTACAAPSLDALLALPAVADLMTTGALRFATPDQPLSSAASKLDKVGPWALGRRSVRPPAGGRLVCVFSPSSMLQCSSAFWPVHTQCVGP